MAQKTRDEGEEKLKGDEQAKAHLRRALNELRLTLEQMESELGTERLRNENAKTLNKSRSTVILAKSKELSALKLENQRILNQHKELSHQVT